MKLKVGLSAINTCIEIHVRNSITKRFELLLIQYLFYQFCVHLSYVHLSIGSVVSVVTCPCVHLSACSVVQCSVVECSVVLCSVVVCSLVECSVVWEPFQLYLHCLHGKTPSIQQSTPWCSIQGQPTQEGQDQRQVLYVQKVPLCKA